jgi:hypothetical protein
MLTTLPLTWYYETPIDFEHKQYVLFSYLQSVETSFINKVVSPHLLHMEKMVIELTNFEESINNLKSNFKKHKYIYLFDNPQLEGENDVLIQELSDIVEFSIPQVKSRIDFGYEVLKKHKQILY